LTPRGSVSKLVVTMNTEISIRHHHHHHAASTGRVVEVRA